MKHEWKRDENGQIITDAVGMGLCDGAVCTVCGYAVCTHCRPDFEEDDDCSGRGVFPEKLLKELEMRACRGLASILAVGSKTTAITYFDYAINKYDSEAVTSSQKHFGWVNGTPVKDIHLKIDGEDFCIPAGTEIWRIVDPHGYKVLGKIFDWSNPGELEVAYIFYWKSLSECPRCKREFDETLTGDEGYSINFCPWCGFYLERDVM